MSDKPAMSLAQTIKEARKLLGMTQDEFAKALKVSTRTICHYENGTRVPKASFMQQLEIKHKHAQVELLQQKASAFTASTPLARDQIENAVRLATEEVVSTVKKFYAATGLVLEINVCFSANRPTYRDENNKVTRKARNAADVVLQYGDIKTKEYVLLQTGASLNSCSSESKES